MFPFTPQIQVEPGWTVHYQDVLDHILPILTPERQARIQNTVRHRTFSVVPVLEDLFDRGNVSACLRSAEAFGLGQVHLIQKNEKFKESQRTTAGADKWVEVKQWKTTADCIGHLKSQGMQIVATHLSPSSVPIGKIDFSKPTAIVLGNEKQGISPEMVELADQSVIIPMLGFVQSFNISVAASLAFYHLTLDRQQRRGSTGDLTAEEQEILKAIYTLRTQDSSGATLRRLKAENKLRT